jgi:4-amino-4-deoxy-L-arabinose transferase-like glycosyltransferase
MLALLMIVPAAIATALRWPRVGLRARRALLAGAAGLPAGGVVVAGADAAGRLCHRLGRIPRLHGRHPVSADGARYTHSWDHHQPAWYFLATMPLMWIPAFLALPWAIPAWRRRLRRRDARYLLPLAWWLMVVLFFSIPAGQARRLHPAGAADVLPGAGAAAAGVAGSDAMCRPWWGCSPAAVTGPGRGWRDGGAG